MTNDAKILRAMFLDAATKAKRDSGAPDNVVVASMLSAAHGFSLRRDPTRNYIDRIFQASTETKQ